MTTRNARRRARGRAGRRSQAQRREPARSPLPYSRRNWTFLGAGVGTILIGYLCLSQPPVDGFLSLTLAPVLLVIGYCVLIPLGLLLGGSEKPAEDASEESMGG
ncbi:MAG: hypothetical protein J4F39_01215 [Candidatus Latescibacteria bacterium]|nr:hypothetical protein [Candidatus Latescibacterota bacterium]